MAANPPDPNKCRQKALVFCSAIFYIRLCMVEVALNMSADIYFKYSNNIILM